MPVFKSDNSGLTVDEKRQVQTALIRHGFDVGPTGADGIFGDKTNAAIMAFKRSIGYAPRPFIGPLTWDQLMADAPDTELTREELPWIKEAMRIVGKHEVEDNAAIRSWLRLDGATLGDPAKLPWCGDFIETAIRLALPTEPFRSPLRENPYWALNWRHLGRAIYKPTYGAIAAISRDGGGHVGIVMGEDATRLYLLGGNQSNRVSVAPFEKTRFVPEAFRWPLMWQLPTDFTLPKLTSSLASSINEA